MEERWEDLSATTTVLTNLTENWNIVWDAKSSRDLVVIVQMEQVLVLTWGVHQCYGHSVDNFHWICHCLLASFCLGHLMSPADSWFVILPCLCVIFDPCSCSKLWLILSASYSLSPWKRNLLPIGWPLSSPLKLPSHLTGSPWPLVRHPRLILLASVRMVGSVQKDRLWAGQAFRGNRFLSDLFS